MLHRDYKSGSSISIRAAQPVDVPRLIRTVNAAFSIEKHLEGTRTDPERLAALMRSGVVLLAEDSVGQLLGCIYAEVRGSSGYLGMLAVDPAHQGAHHGRALMAAAEAHLRSKGCAAVQIDVLNWRSELLPIYRRFGYIETGIEPFCPSQPLKPGIECHCVVMSKTL
ncbi:MAG: GNAT family N-acetyltransferase [Acidobacteriaceae bacterium]|nr:GNAT family N-acetyltransferase [Acidobacteriaceae bacterium]